MTCQSQPTNPVDRIDDQMPPLALRQQGDAPGLFRSTGLRAGSFRSGVSLSARSWWTTRSCSGETCL